MTQELENLVTELCAFDADLAKDPTSVRRMVAELQRSKPEVVIDDVFRAQLREKLLHTHVKPVPSKALPWWFLYTAPLGIVALLLFMVHPILTPSPRIVPETVPGVPAGSMLKMSPTVTNDGYGGEAMSDSANQDTVTQSTTDYFTAMITNDAVVVTYLITTQPSYIVVTDTKGAVVAVSELLHPSEHTDYTFKARVPFTSGAVYTATLRYDNGDGVYEPNDDVIATDVSGAPLSLPLALP